MTAAAKATADLETQIVYLREKAREYQIPEGQNPEWKAAIFMAAAFSAAAEVLDTALRVASKANWGEKEAVAQTAEHSENGRRAP